MTETEITVLKKMRRAFITGIFLIAPTYITIIVILWLFNHLDAPLRNFISALVPWAAPPGIGVAATFLLIMLAGAVAQNFIAKALFAGLERLVLGVPVIRTLYSGVKQLLSPLSPEESAQFQRVVLVEWPGHELYALGFLVRPEACVGPDGRSMSAVLIPSNHLHLGNVVLVPDSRVHPLDMKIEEGLKFLVSMGAALDRPIRPDLARPGTRAEAGQGA